MYPGMFIAALVVLFSLPARSQRHFTVAQFSYESDMNENGFSRYQFTSNLPLIRSGKHVLVVSPSAEILGLPHAMKTPGGVALPFTYMRKTGNRLTLQCSFIPRMNDLAFESNNLQLGLMALAEIKRNDSLKFRFGLYYNKEYFGDFFVPLAGIDYRINKRTYLYGTLPGSMTFEKTYGEKFSAGLNFRSFTGSYITGFMYPLPDRNYPVRLTESKLAVCGETKLLGDIYLRTELGHTLTRRFTYYGYEGTGDLVYIKGSPFFNITLAYRVKKQED